MHKGGNKRQMNKNVKKETSRGITLIALVITIIVLLILEEVALVFFPVEDRYKWKN